MGEMPEWWPYFTAAEQCHAPVWDVAGLPETAGDRCWVEWALMRAAALADAQEELRIQAEIARG